MQQQGLEIEKVKYDLEKNVIVDSKQLHQNLTLANLRGNHSKLNILKNLNQMKLIKGYPSYCALKLNLHEKSQESGLKFPLCVKVFRNEALDKMKNMNSAQALKRVELLEPATDKKLYEKLKMTDVFISKNCRLPS